MTKQTETSIFSCHHILTVEGSMITMMKDNAGKQRVSFCDEANSMQSIEFDLSHEECEAAWYSQEEFQQMKTSGLQTLAHRKSPHMLCCHQDDRCCLRGLDKSSKHMRKHRRQVIRSIVQMYWQMQGVPCQTASDEDERNELLRSYCISKTRYAQHNAKYVAVQDAIAVQNNNWVACGCRELVPMQSSPVSFRHGTSHSPRESNVVNNNNMDKALSMSTVSYSRSPLVQRRPPMRAVMA
jgi:hypothetical protein